MKKKFLATLVIALTFCLVAISVSPSSASVGLVASAKPIVNPDPSDKFDCTQSALEVVRTDGGFFNRNDYLELTYRFPQVDSENVERKSFVHQSRTGGANKYLVPRSLLSPSQISGATMIYQLCTYNLPEVPVTKIELKIAYKNLMGDLSALEYVRVTVDILQRSTDALVVENLQDACQMNTTAPFFEHNLLISQSVKPGKSGGKTSISGTLFVRGVAAPNTKIEFREENPGVFTKLGKWLGSVTTDTKGQFKFSFRISKYKGYWVTPVEAYVPERLVALGPLGLASDEFATTLDFNWDKGGAYLTGIDDWIPAPSGECLNAYDAYEKYFNDHRDEDRNHIWKYVAKRVFYAVKGKKAKSVFGGYGSGKCYVSGHYRSGTWVNGYFRSC